MPMHSTHSFIHSLNLMQCAMQSNEQRSCSKMELGQTLPESNGGSTDQLSAWSYLIGLMVDG